ncbi:SNARE domain- containing protein [Candidatus Bathyarchaeota archaeon]|nr:SNARE domain- containing protein [Candidatus Bathyarchaeota archaeon]
MSESYERERQNNARLDELSAKVSALRGVTVDIYDNARAQDVLDNTVSPPFFWDLRLGRAIREGKGKGRQGC